MTCRILIKVKEGKYIYQHSIRGKDLMFTLTVGFIFAINKLFRIRVSN